MTVRFLLDGEVIEIAEVAPDDTLLDFLRYRLRRTGSKEGCAEGDCGACTVLVGAPGEREGEGEGDDGKGQVAWRAVNACILFLPMLHGRAVMTVESLSRDGTLTPLQECMAANGSSQCGFCTPGFVMSLHGRAIGARGADLPVADVIAGNLCRCTGYGPILAAGDMAAQAPQDEAALAAQLARLGGDSASGGREGRRWFAPGSIEELAALLAQYPGARIVAGATDVGLWVTKRLDDLATVIFIGQIAELARLESDAQELRLGAGLRYADAHAALAMLHPDLGELVRRLGGLQVRNAATIGGNIANGSPIGDGPPALIALAARLTLRSAAGSRTIPLEDYFLDYGKQDLRPGEFVESVAVPRPSPAAVIQIVKLSRRFDSDISAVCGAFMLERAGDAIASARVAFGGMAATPRRAPACEAALTGQPWSRETFERAAAALAEDFRPLNDVRGSSEYRLLAAGNLLRRLWLRKAGAPVSVLDVEPVDG
jgi:xanthine dehydrogenase small subunit